MNDPTIPSPAEPAPREAPGVDLPKIRRDLEAVYDAATNELEAALAAKKAVALRVAKARTAFREAQQAARALGAIPSYTEAKAAK